MVSLYEVVEVARKTGKIEKGTNEVTKAIERGTAKLVVYAEDVSPKEIVQHLPALCKEKGIICSPVDNKKKLGVSAGISVGCASIAIIEAGDAAKHLNELGVKAETKKSEKTEKKK
jgi:large subunit ribosomal protein L7Ae